METSGEIEKKKKFKEKGNSIRSRKCFEVSGIVLMNRLTLNVICLINLNFIAKDNVDAFSCFI